MALTWPPPLALHPNDEEDVDFFDHLANDLDHGDENLEKGEGILEDVLAQLSISGAAISDNGRVDDDFWMQETVLNNRADGNVVMVNYPEANGGTCLDATPPPLLGADGNVATANSREANGATCPPSEEKELDAEGNLSEENSRSSLDILPPSLSQGRDLSGPVLDQSSILNATPDGASDSCLPLENVHAPSLQSDLVSYNSSDMDRSQRSQTNTTELQWSSFSAIFSSGSDPFSDFISELDVGTEAFSNPNVGYEPGLKPVSPTVRNSSAQSKWKVESENHADQGIPGSFGEDNAGVQLHDYGVYHTHNQLESHQTQVSSANHYDSSARVDYGISNKPGGNGMAFVGEGRSDNQSAGMQLQQVHNVTHEQTIQLQRSKVMSTESAVQGMSLGEEGQIHGGSYANISNYQAQEQVGQSQIWDSMYPGWYFDCLSNTWKQVDGWDFGTGSMAAEHHGVGSTASLDVYSSSTTTDAVSFQLETSQIAVSGQASLFGSGHDVNDHAPYTGSFWHTKQRDASELASGLDLEGYNPSSSEQRTIDGGLDMSQQMHLEDDLQSQQQVQWDKQYPGWYFDDRSQQWQQITADSNQSLVSGESIHSLSSSLGQSDHQRETNKNIHWPEQTEVFYENGGEKATLAPNLTYHSWKPRAMVTTDLNESVDPQNEKMQEPFQFKNDEQGYGIPNYFNGMSQYYSQPEVQSTFQETSSVYSQPEVQSTFQETSFGSKSSSNFFHSQEYNQSQNGYGLGTEMRRFTLERPSHALVAFGFGGKLVTMKASSNPTPEAIMVYELNQLVLAANNSGQNDGVSYFSCLSRGGLTGPLVGGGISTKDLVKWVDDRVVSCDAHDPHSTSVEAVRVLWSVLRITCLHYGKLRPISGSSGSKSQSEDGPEVELGRLLSSANNKNWNEGTGVSPVGLQSTPSGDQLQVIALEMKRRLVDGKRKEALQLAQQGQLWGPALVLAWQLGEKAYAETVVQMAQQQFVPGSPLRTLFLLFAGQTAELFTTKGSSAAALGPDLSGSYNVKDSAGGMLGDWMGNLSIIAANPTNGDEQVIMHLGDCLWKDHGEVAGAHTCYLIADAKFESFSENARLCLVGADHFKFQRTFTTPLAIQRTELYEYAKVLGNSQFVLQPFQPYKLLYAYMLVEGGKVSEARRYCQAVTKTLRNAGRSPEMEFCRQSAADLEERLRLHSQGGYSLNSATGKLVGKFIGTLDNTIHRIIGGPPPRQASEPSLNRNPKDWYSTGQRVSNSVMLAKTSTLAPSESNANGGKLSNRAVEAPPRSVSEPNLSWSLVKKEQNNFTSPEVDAVSSKEAKTEPSRAGYLGRFGSQLFSKAVGFIKPNKKQADLGDKNKFYYDKDLNKWVEEGAEQLVEELAPPPPPITASFYSSGTSVSSDGKVGAGTEVAESSAALSREMPPLPPSASQFSARGRLQGVRSRYVDTFNKGGTLPAKPTESPIVPTSIVPPPAQFFMPAHPATSTDFSYSSKNGQFSNSNLSSATSFTENIHSHAYGNETIVPTEGMGGSMSAAVGFSSGVARDASWSGVSHVTEFIRNSSDLPVPQSSVWPRGDSLHSSPFPPVIEPVSGVGVDNCIAGKEDGFMHAGIPSSEGGGMFADLQEVAL